MKKFKFVLMIFILSFANCKDGKLLSKEKSVCNEIKNYIQKDELNKFLVGEWYTNVGAGGIEFKINDKGEIQEEEFANFFLTNKQGAVIIIDNEKKTNKIAKIICTTLFASSQITLRIDFDEVLGFEKMIDRGNYILEKTIIDLK